MISTSISQWLLVHVASSLLFVLVVVVTAAVGIGIMLLVRRYAPHFSDGVNNTVGGVLMAILGTMYAVVLGFVVVTLWTTIDRAEETVRQEAGALLDLYRDNTTLSFRVATQTQQAVRDYAQSAVDEEWPALAEGRTSRRTDRAAQRIFEVYRDYEPTTTAQASMLSASTGRYDDFLAARRTRLSLAQSGLPGVFWVTILLGGVVTVGFGAFLGQQSFGAHLAMTAALGVMVGLMLAVVLLLNHPFSGNLSVSSGPLRALLSAG